MQSRSDPADLPLATGIIAGTVTLAAGAKAPPDWIKLTPRGPITTRDGRSYAFNPDVLAARFAQDGIAIPLDTDHSTLLRGALGEAPNTIGYLSAVEAREDGTHGKVDWIDPVRAMQQLRTHRFVSPSFHHDSGGAATWLHSAALVSAPALAMPALATALAHEGHPMKQIAKALGLAETATEAECLAALATRTETKPLAAALGLADGTDAKACLAAIGTLRQGGNQADLVAQLQSNYAAATTRLQAVEKAARDKDVADVVEGALKARKIVPAQKDHYVALCATDDGLKTVRAMLAATPEGLQASNLDASRAETGDVTDPAALAAEARALVEERRKAGQSLGMAEAVTIVSSRKK